VVGVDEDVAAAQRRGLQAVQLRPLVLSAGALQPELAAMGALFDAAVFYAWPSGGGSGSSGSDALTGSWLRAESLAELRRVLKPGGRLCVQAHAQDEAAVEQQLEAAGFAVRDCERLACGALRLVATTL
jgi:SAM-dependent methyltransferase